MLLPIALTAAGAAALIHLWLSLRVSQVRRVAKVAHGDGGNAALGRRMRAHANFVENTPFFLVLVALLELSGVRAEYLWVAVILFIAARLAHPFGMDQDGAPRLRVVPVALSWTVLAALAVWAIATTYGRVAEDAGENAPTVLRS